MYTRKPESRRRETALAVAVFALPLLAGLLVDATAGRAWGFGAFVLVGLVVGIAAHRAGRRDART